MEAGITIMAMIIIYVALDIVRERSRRKWYARGYERACYKYNAVHYDREITYMEEGEEAFRENHSSQYD